MEKEGSTDKNNRVILRRWKKERVVSAIGGGASFFKKAVGRAVCRVIVFSPAKSSVDGGVFLFPELL
jgi:hypothetical protein